MCFCGDFGGNRKRFCNFAKSKENILLKTEPNEETYIVRSRRFAVFLMR